MLGLQASGWPSIALFGLPGFLFLSKQRLGGGGVGNQNMPSPFPPVSAESYDLANQSLPSDLRSGLAQMVPHPTMQD